MSKQDRARALGRSGLVAALVGGSLLVACGESGGGDTAATGGVSDQGSGGLDSTGGASAVSGGATTGGLSATGGLTAAGGSSGSGGAGASGGTSPAGGTATGGGAATTGGATGSGGAGTGGSNTGGSTIELGGSGGAGTGGTAPSGGAATGGDGATSTGGTDATGGAADTGGTGTGGAADCAGHAVSLAANGTADASDAAYANVEIDLGSDLPLGNTPRTVEFWAFIRSTDWIGEKNEIYYYGGGSNTSGFGLDFGTNPVSGSTTNHATLNPVTGGGFNDDSTNDLGIDSSTDQWVHIAMVWDGSALLTYVNGSLKITSHGNGVTALATTSENPFVLGCNPTNQACFGGYFDELRVWNVARSAADIQASYNKPVAGDETGLVGYWKFNEASGTTAADSVSSAGHTAHAGTLKATDASQVPTFIEPAVALPLVCP